MSLVKEGGVPSPVDNFARAVLSLARDLPRLLRALGEALPNGAI
jgi:hypothetical protein